MLYQTSYLLGFSYLVIIGTTIRQRNRRKAINITETCKKTIENIGKLETLVCEISSNAMSVSEEVVGGFLFTGVPTFDHSSFNAILIEKGLA